MKTHQVPGVGDPAGKKERKLETSGESKIN